MACGHQNELPVVPLPAAGRFSEGRPTIVLPDGRVNRAPDRSIRGGTNGIRAYQADHHRRLDTTTDEDACCSFPFFLRAGGSISRSAWPSSRLDALSRWRRGAGQEAVAPVSLPPRRPACRCASRASTPAEGR